jgi:hypothetical protein
MTLPFDIVVTPIRIIFTIFALFAWSRAYLRWQERLFTLKEFAFWTFVWVGVIVLIFTPGKTDFIAEWLGVGRGSDAIFAVGLVLIFYMVYRLYAKVDKLERDLAKLIQHLALTRGRRTRKDS